MSIEQYFQWIFEQVKEKRPAFCESGCSVNVMLVGFSNNPTHKLDLSLFPKGVYFITIRSKDFVTTRKIIKY